MAIQIQKIEPHWNYLLALERSIDEVSRYIEFDEGNFECFSIEIARILLACGAEVDVVCKQICRSISSTSDANNINMYRDEIGLFSLYLVIHFTLVVNQAILGLAPLAAKIGAIERGLSKASGGVH